jgi:hypothetical protein
MSSIAQLRKQIKFEIVEISPKMAHEMLKSNSHNRRLRAGHVAKLAWAFKRGEYGMTHQGIAFDSEGVLLDGQNRLNAIEECPEHMVFPMVVSHGWDRSTCWKNIDHGLAVRSIADVLELHKAHAEVSNVFARILIGSSATTPALVEPIADFFEDEFKELHDFCPAKGKMWGSAPVRAAALYTMKRGYADYAKRVFRALVTSDFEAMPKVAQSAYRANVNGTLSAVNKFDTFARCLKIFDPKCANLTRTVVRDQSEIIADVRQFLEREVIGVANSYKSKAKVTA